MPQPPKSSSASATEPRPQRGRSSSTKADRPRVPGELDLDQARHDEICDARGIRRGSALFEILPTDPGYERPAAPEE